VESHTPAQKPEYEKVKEAVKETVLEEKQEKIISSRVAELRKGAKITYLFPELDMPDTSLDGQSVE